MAWASARTADKDQSRREHCHRAKLRQKHSMPHIGNPHRDGSDDWERDRGSGGCTSEAEKRPRAPSDARSSAVLDTADTYPR
eukprot:5959146-Pleurochrysis_carterae.AAC.1